MPVNFSRPQSQGKVEMMYFLQSPATLYFLQSPAILYFLMSISD